MLGGSQGTLFASSCRPPAHCLQRVPFFVGRYARYDKLAPDYLAYIQLASIRLWLRVNEFTPFCYGPRRSPDVAQTDVALNAVADEGIIESKLIAGLGVEADAGAELGA